MHLARTIILSCLFIGCLSNDLLAQLTAQSERRVTQLNEQIAQLENQGNDRAAIPLQKEIVDIAERELGHNKSETAYEWNYLGHLYFRLGEYGEARNPYSQALSIRRKVLGENDEDTGESYGNVGFVLAELGEYDQSEDAYLQALRIYRRNTGDESSETLQTMNNLGNLYLKTSNFEKAKSLNRSALAIRTRTLGPDHADVGESLFNLGVIAHEEGDYNKAQELYSRSRSIFQEALGEEHPYTLQLMNNLGKLAYDLGDVQRSYDIDRQVYDIRMRVLGPDHIDTAQSLNNMAFNQQDQRNFEEALPLYQKALDIFLKQLGEKDVNTQLTMLNLAVVKQRLGQSQEAEDLATRALNLRRESLGEGHPLVSEALYQIATVRLEAGRLDEAREAFEQSYKIMQDAYGDNHPKTLSVLFSLCWINMRNEDWARVLELSNKTRRLVRTTGARLMAGLTPAEQLRLLNKDDHHEFAFTVAWQKKDDQAFADSSASWIINDKGLSQETLAARETLLRDLGDAETQTLSRKLQETRRSLANIVLSAPKADQVELKKRQVEQLTQQEEELSRQLAKKVGASVELEKWIELDEVREKLKHDETFITWIRFQPYDFDNESQISGYLLPPRYMAWIIPPAGQREVRLIDIGPAEEIDSLIEKARKELNAAGRPDGAIRNEGEQDAEKKLRRSLADVAEKVWLPVATHLGDETKKINLSPDGALWLVPWAALPDGDDRYLIEDFAFRYLISGREFVQEVAAPSSNTPLVFANPTFDLTPQKVIAAVKAIFRDVQLDANASRGRVSQTALGKVPSLPNTEIEANAIAPSLEKLVGKPPIKYLGEYALESVVKRVHRPRMLVLSTHGYFLPDQQMRSNERSIHNDKARAASLLAIDGTLIENPLLRCGLLLAGCNQPPAGGDDGILTGLEIVGLDLRGTELVVLSACETGIGKVQIGEGIAGLRQAFQLAGASSVVATLWQVPDRDSAVVMKDFFDQLAAETPPADALRSAQLARIESRRERYGAAHPFFWAAWTLTGKPRDD